MIAKWRVALLALTACCLTGVAHAQDKKPLVQETTSVLTRTVKVDGKDKSVTQTTRLAAELTPTEGGFKYKVVSVKVDLGDKASFDSAKTNEKGPVADYFKSLVGLELTLKVGKDGKVTVDGTDKILTGRPAEAGVYVTGRAADLILGGIRQLPGEDKEKKAWDASSDLDLAKLGKLTITTKVTNEGADAAKKNLEKLKLEVSTKYVAPENAPDAGGFSIKKAELKTTKAEGKATFNNQTKWLDTAELTVEVGGTLTIESAGSSKEATVTLKQKVTTKVTEKAS